jgi:GTP-binding protein Era
MINLQNGFKSGFVTIVGRPNVGKSTLMNYLVGEKLSIISNKPQTTRNTIQTVLTKDNYQVVFLDTPGIHKPRHALGEYMVKVAEDTLNEVDVVLFMTTPDGELGTGDRFIIDQLKKVKTNVVLVVNKTDQVPKEKIIKTVEAFNSEYEFCDIVPVSALSGSNVDELMKVIVERLPEGPKYFPDDMLTDQPERSVIAEIIREKALNLLDQEVPHGIAVEVEQMKEDENDKSINISAVIYCEKESHKGIIIGREGAMLKKIKTLSRTDIKRLLGTNARLELWVKVKKGWRDDPSAIRNFGYK